MPSVGVAVGALERLIEENGEPDTWNPSPPMVWSAAFAVFATPEVSTSRARLAQWKLFTAESSCRGLECWETCGSADRPAAPGVSAGGVRRMRPCRIRAARD